MLTGTAGTQQQNILAIRYGQLDRTRKHAISSLTATLLVVPQKTLAVLRTTSPRCSTA